MDRALREFRVRGVVTNLRFLEQVITHPHFRDGAYTTRFIDETPELFRFPRKRDRATRLLRFVARRDRQRQSGGDRPRRARRRIVRRASAEAAASSAPPPGTKQRLDELGAAEVRAVDAASSRRCCSPTRRSATRTSRCWRRACARTTWSPSRRPTRASRRSCSRSNAGAAPRSTSRCASCGNARGTA